MFSPLLYTVFYKAGQTSRVSSSHPNTEKSSYKHISGNEWFLSLTARLHSTVNTVTV
jgi:hypothetical protein